MLPRLAITGTPGTGKSSVAARLGRSAHAVEVAELAERTGTARPTRRGVEVDLARLRTALRRPHGWGDARVVVGHLAHLLPVRDVVVLRCHPHELARRLLLARRGTARERRENVLAEALDVVLAEAVRPGRRVWEVDTTDRTVGAVARRVGRLLARRGRPSYGGVDWLSDPEVTAHLLDRGP